MSEMELTPLQQEMRDGAFGKGTAMAMNIQCAVGESFGARRMVPVSRVHIALSAQNADIWFTEKMTDAGARARVTPTVNPGYCVEYFREKGILTGSGAENMIRTEAAYRKLGARLTYSCTPYLRENTPAFGEICAFSETSVTIYANSVLGARTNRESAMSAACAAITGFVPEYGMLLPENRRPTVRVEVRARVDDAYRFALLGLCGKKIGRGIPLFTGLPESIDTESLISLGASLNVSGSFDMFHIPGVTPEISDPGAGSLFAGESGSEPAEDCTGMREVIIGEEDLEEALRIYSGPCPETVDYVILGCPHYTAGQVQAVQRFLAGRRTAVPVMVLTSRTVWEELQGEGIPGRLSEQNVSLIPDTCVDESCCFRHLASGRGVTDSPKAAYYMETFGLRLAVRSAETCLRWALTGKTGDDIVGSGGI